MKKWQKLWWGTLEFGMESFVFLSSTECQNMGLTLGGSPFGLSWGTSLPPSRIFCHGMGWIEILYLLDTTCWFLELKKTQANNLYASFSLSLSLPTSRTYLNHSTTHWLFTRPGKLISLSWQPYPHPPSISNFGNFWLIVSLSHMAEIAQLYGGGTDRRLNREWRQR